MTLAPSPDRATEARAASAEGPAGRPWWRSRPHWLRVGASLASGVATAVAFPPFDAGPLVLVALVPLLWAWRDARPRHAALYGFVWGLGCYGLVLEWLRYFGTVATVALVLPMAGTVGLVGVVVTLLARRGMRSPLLTAAVWVVMEAIRGRVPLGGFPWADVGVALHGVGAARALASLGGVALISLVVVTTNGFVLDGLFGWRAADRRRLVLASGGIAIVVAFGAVADVARFEPTPTGHLRFALLQGDDRLLPLHAQQNQLLTAAHLVLAARLRGHYDLIVFPESSLDTDPQQDPALRSELAAIASAHDASLLVNARTPGTNGELRNSNLLYEPDGRLQGVYSKQHLVPFGEYVPWRSELGFIGDLRQIPYDFQPGQRRVSFDVAGHQLASVICFESAFSPLVRDFVRDGAEAIVVSTNNRSYRRSGNSEQHLALSQLRAAETARPVLQASVSGISSVIDADGNVRDTTRLFRRAVVSGSITTMTGETPYVRLGDWVPLVAALALAAVSGSVAWRRRRRPASPPVE
jgi:apolipoprotein N-acyltransferase